MGYQRGQQAPKPAPTSDRQSEPSTQAQNRPEHPVDIIQAMFGSRAASRQFRAGDGVANLVGRSLSPVSPRVQGKPLFRGVSQEWGTAPSTGLVIQPKLAIGAPNDRYEQEADRVAEQVVQRLNAPEVGRSPTNETLQRETLPEKEDELQMKSLRQREAMPGDAVELQMKPTSQGGGAIAASDNLESAIQQSRSGGQPLADSIRKPMEQAFGGVDFSGVKVHTDGRSDQLNRSIQANAFTTLQDIYFRNGTYEPGNRDGQALIAHELTHVVQQQNVRGITTARIDSQWGGERKNDQGIQEKRQSAQPETPIERPIIAGRTGSDTIHVQCQFTVDNPNWDEVTSVSASITGGSGVLFLTNGAGEQLIIKPQIRGEDEAVAARIHLGMSKDSKDWRIKGVKMRVLTSSEETALIGKLKTINPTSNTQKAIDLINKIGMKGWQTMVNEVAPGHNLAEALRHKRTETHIKLPGERQFGSKPKVRDDSPLKPFMNKDFIQNLGRLAAADIFVGNFDRLISYVNFENIMTDVNNKTISPIDNVQELDLRFGGGNIDGWKKNGYVMYMKDGKYKDIAQRMWKPDGQGTIVLLGDIGKGLNIKVEQNSKGHYVPDQVRGDGRMIVSQDPSKKNEMEAVIQKWSSKIEIVIEEFAKGVKEGNNDIKELGYVIPGDNILSKEGLDQYRERYDYLYT